jgi:hypothetical protein
MTWGPPKWIARSEDGTLWHLVSARGRRLGIVLQIGGKWRAAKVCQPKFRDFTSIRDAAAYALTSLHCEDCIPNAWRQN